MNDLALLIEVLRDLADGMHELNSAFEQELEKM